MSAIQPSRTCVARRCRPGRTMSHGIELIRLRQWTLCARLSCRKVRFANEKNVSGMGGKKNGHFHQDISFWKFHSSNRKPSVGLVLFYRTGIRRCVKPACRLCSSGDRVLQKNCNKSGNTKAGQNVIVGNSGATGNNNILVAVRRVETRRMMIGRRGVFTSQRLCLGRILPVTHASIRACFICVGQERDHATPEH